MHGGVGSAARRLPRSGVVGAIVAVNSVGAVRDPASAGWVAGSRGPGGRIVAPSAVMPPGEPARGTTLALVATDLALDRPALARIASIVHAGLSRVIVPYQTSSDGDAVFAVATGSSARRPTEKWPGALADRVGTLAAESAIEAVLSAVRASNPRST